MDPQNADPATAIDTTTEFEQATATHTDVDGPVQMLPDFGTPAVQCHDENADLDVALNAADKAHIPIMSLHTMIGTLVGDNTGVVDGLADGVGHTGVVPNRPWDVLSFVRHDA